MHILICGHGFVGQAHAFALEQTHEVTVYDPAKGHKGWKIKPDGVVICVSTPAHKNGACNINNVYDVLEHTDHRVPVLIKSTISLEGWLYLVKTFPKHKLTFSPEYLRADHAFEDFAKQNTIWLGGGDVEFWQKVLCVLDVDFETAQPEELILTKYFRNSFLAAKVAFFNQIHDLCVDANVDPERVCKLVAKDKRIGSSHTVVTQERGYGGHCFPKDVSAILHTAELLGNDLSILQEVQNYNNDVREYHASRIHV